MKENWIAKLVELLNEYNGKTYDYSKLSNLFYRWEYESYEEVTEEKLISKKYWFIKWLVDNDKIDESKIEIHWFSFYESVLMELAIKDNPIEFLISILK